MAVLDGELAVPCDLQTAYAGSIAFWRFFGLLVLFKQVVLKAGSHAMRLCEPGQMRKQAAISICTYVPWGCLVGANCLKSSTERKSKKSARPFLLIF